MSGAALIQLADPETDNGLAQMLATLLRQNVTERPEKAKYLTSMRRNFLIIGNDMDLMVTLEFSLEGLTVHGGAHGMPHVIIIADSSTLLDLSRLTVLRGAVPVMWDEVGKQILAKMRSGKLSIKGALLYPVELSRLTHLMSVNS